MSTEHMHVTSSRVFNNNSKKKIARNCVEHNCVFRVELDESQCKCRFFLVLCYACRVNVFLFPFVFGFRIGMISAGSGITVLLCGLKQFTYSGPCSCRRALPVYHPRVSPCIDHASRWCTCFYEL